MSALKPLILKYLQKFVLDVLPSVAATVIGALIVTHYVNPRPADRAPPVAAAPAQAGSDGARRTEPKAADTKPAEDKAVAARPAESERPADPPARETAARARPAAGEARQPDLRKTVDERRDANELARAAINRLRDGEARRPTEAVRPEPRQAEVRSSDQKLVQNAATAPQTPPPQLIPARIAAPSAPPLPSAIDVAPTTGSIPAEPVAVPAPDDAASPHGRSARFDRPVPPADIPSAKPPLELSATADEPPPPSASTSVAEDVLNATRSIFRAVTPR